MIKFKASFFDGESSAATEVRVTLGADSSLTVNHSTLGDQVFQLGEYKYLSRVGRSPLRWRLKNGSLIEAPFDQELARLVEQQSSVVYRAILALESRLHLAFGSLLAAGLLCWVIYLYGLPLFAQALRPLVPESLKEIVGDNALSVVERLFFEESEIAAADQQQVIARAGALGRYTVIGDRLQVLVKKMTINKEEVDNAMAILPRTVIVTDALIKNLTPDEVEGVIAHELGHLVKDHGTQQLIRGSAISLVSIALFGADPGTFQALALAVVEAQYSQEHETEADRFAVDLLRSIGKDPKVLASALEKISEKDSGDKAMNYLSSHPPTAERVRMLRGGV